MDDTNSYSTFCGSAQTSIDDNEQKLLFSLLGISLALTDLQDILNRKVMIQSDTDVHCTPKGRKDGKENLCKGVRGQSRPNFAYRATDESNAN